MLCLIIGNTVGSPLGLFYRVGIGACFRERDLPEGFGIVRLNRRRNFIDKNGNFLSDQWFDGACGFREGFARVGLNGKWNFVDKNGNLLSDRWFDWVGDFREGFASVILNGKSYIINTSGEITVF